MIKFANMLQSLILDPGTFRGSAMRKPEEKERRLSVLFLPCLRQAVSARKDN
jgi:hypothetical protein